MNINFINSLAAASAGVPAESGDATASFGERLAFGGQVTLIGILIVFAVLALLWGVLILFKKFFYDIPEKKKASARAAILTPEPKVTVTPDPVTQAGEDDTQLIAVITAAIAAYNSENGRQGLPFRVVSFKRARGANGWSGADENETV